jgi:glycosyltransferase involved in cell wall biosynthesis
MKISVIMPAYNSEAYIDRSIQDVLRQTHQDLELICIDDASRDDTAERITYHARNDRRVTLVTHFENRGAAAARNTGLERATGDIIAFLDADDGWSAHKLAEGVRSFWKYPADVVYTDAVLIDQDGNEVGKFSDRFPVPPYGLPEILLRNWICFSSVLVKREAISKHTFNTNIRMVEDWEFLTQLAEHATIYHDPAPLVFYRVHAQNSIGTFGSNELALNRIKVFRENLRRYKTELKRDRFARSRVQYHLGRALEITKNRKEARKAYAIAALSNPSNLKTFARLALCHLSR